MDFGKRCLRFYPAIEDLRSTVSRMNEMRLNGEFCDSVLKTDDGGSFPVHRAVLISSSDYFKALFMSALNKGDRSSIVVPQIKAEPLGHIIEFAYNRSLKLSAFYIWELIASADMLLFKSLVAKCYEHLWPQVTLKCCMRFYQNIRQYYVKEFEETARSYVLANFRQLLDGGNSVMDVSADTLVPILKDDRLTMNEEDVWQLVKEWIEKSPDNRKKHASTLIGCLRLAYFDTKYIFKNIMCHPLVVKDEGCRKVIDRRQQLLWNLADAFCSDDVDTPYIAKPRMPMDLLFTVGGYNRQSHETTGLVEVYDNKADIWHQVKNGSEIEGAKRESHVCVFLNNCIYILGGEQRNPSMIRSNMNCWDLVKNTWRTVSPMKYERSNFSALTVHGKIIAIGGWQPDAGVLSSVEQYIPILDSWRPLPSLNTSRCCTASTIFDKKIYLLGGSTNRVNSLDTVEVLNTEAGIWESISRMTESRRGAAAVTYKGQVIVAGGKQQSSVEKYDPATGIWTMIESLLKPRYFFTLVVLDNTLFAIGGTPGSYVSDHVCSTEVYHEATNTWRVLPSSTPNVIMRGTCIAHSLPNAEFYVDSGRSNLLATKAKLIVTLTENGETEKAKDLSFNLFPAYAD